MGKARFVVFRVVISALFSNGVGGPAPQFRVLPRADHGVRRVESQMMDGLELGS